MDPHDDESDDDELHGVDDQDQSPEPSTAAKGKAPAKGRKKEAGESRKAQNRIAQREFRLRKQQYIRELETRIEVLSANSDTRFDHLRDVVRALIDENKDLRQMLASMGNFFKTDLGSMLPKMGMTSELYDEIINKGNSQTALDAFIKSKERIQGFAGAATPAIPSQTLSHSIFAGTSGGGGGANNNSPKTGGAAAPKRKRTSTLPEKDKEGGPSKQASGLGSQKDAGDEGERNGKRRATEGTAPATATHSPDQHSPASTSTPQSAATGSHDLPPTGYSILSTAEFTADLPPRRSTEPVRPSSLVINSPAPAAQPSTTGYFGADFGGGAGTVPPNGTSHLSYQHQAYSDLLGIGSSSSAPNAQYMPASGLPPAQGLPTPGLTAYSQYLANGAAGGGTAATPGFPGFDPNLALPFDFGSAFDFSFTPGPSTAGPLPNPTPAQQPFAPPPPPPPPPSADSSSNANAILDSPQPILRPLRPDESPEEYFESPEVRASIALQGEKQQQAMQLIGYHLSNFRANPSYHLPPSLVPTTLQRTVPHGRLIDGIPLPSLRDLMIIHRDKFNLGVALHQMFAEFKMHGSDVLSADSWEIGEVWMRLYPFLVDRRMVDSANRWRAARGDDLLDFDEFRRLAAGGPPAEMP